MPDALIPFCTFQLILTNGNEVELLKFKTVIHGRFWVDYTI